MRVILNVQVGTCVAKDEVVIADETWAAMSRSERDFEAAAYLEGHVSNSVDSWWEAVDE